MPPFKSQGEMPAAELPPTYFLDQLFPVLEKTTERREVTIEVTKLKRRFTFKKENGNFLWKERGPRWREDSFASYLNSVIPHDMQRNMSFAVVGLSPQEPEIFKEEKELVPLDELVRAYGDLFTVSEINTVRARNPYDARERMPEVRDLYRKLARSGELKRLFGKTVIRQMCVRAPLSAEAFLRELVPSLKEIHERIRVLWGEDADFVIERASAYLRPLYLKGNRKVHVDNLLQMLRDANPEAIRTCETLVLEATQRGGFNTDRLLDELSQKAGLSRTLVTFSVAALLDTTRVSQKLGALSRRNGDTSSGFGLSLDARPDDGRSYHETTGDDDAGFDITEWVLALEKYIPGVSREEYEMLAHELVSEEITESQFEHVLALVEAGSAGKDGRWIFAQVSSILLMEFERVDPVLLAGILKTQEEQRKIRRR